MHREINIRCFLWLEINKSGKATKRRLFDWQLPKQQACASWRAKTRTQLNKTAKYAGFPSQASRFVFFSKAGEQQPGSSEEKARSLLLQYQPGVAHRWSQGAYVAGTWGY
jgi:hypothetical protein